MLPVVTSARSPMLSVVPIIFVTKNASNSLQLLCQADVPELTTSGESGFCLGLAGLHSLALGEHQVSLNFFVEFFIAPLSPPHWEFHVSPAFFAGFMIPAIAVVSLCQRERSETNCFRPDFVKR